MRDINTRSTAADSHMRTSIFEMSNMQLEPGHVDTRGEEVSCAEGEGKVKMVQYLLGELKTLIAGEGQLNLWTPDLSCHSMIQCLHCCIPCVCVCV